MISGLANIVIETTQNKTQREKISLKKKKETKHHWVMGLQTAKKYVIGIPKG